MRNKTVVHLLSYLCLLLVAFAFSGCSLSGAPIPEGMDSESTIAMAQDIAVSLSKGEYDAVAEQFSDEMKAQLSAQSLRDALSKDISKRGEVTKFLSHSIRGGVDDEAGEYAVVVLVCKCENGTSTFTISIDTDMKICGLYMK